MIPQYSITHFLKVLDSMMLGELQSTSSFGIRWRLLGGSHISNIGKLHRRYLLLVCLHYQKFWLPKNTNRFRWFCNKDKPCHQYFRSWNPRRKNVELSWEHPGIPNSKTNDQLFGFRPIQHSAKHELSENSYPNIWEGYGRNRIISEQKYSQRTDLNILLRFRWWELLYWTSFFQLTFPEIIPIVGFLWRVTFFFFHTFLLTDPCEKLFVAFPKSVSRMIVYLVV